MSQPNKRNNPKGSSDFATDVGSSVEPKGPMSKYHQRGETDLEPFIENAGPALHKTPGTPWELVESRKKNQELEAKILDLQAKIQQHERANKIAKNNLELYENRIIQLQEHLGACKDDLFRLQPVVQVTDAEIMGQFDTICEEVSSWVDTEISSFMRGARKDKDEPLFSDGGIGFVSSLLKENPQSGEYMICHLIHRLLQDECFGDHVYFVGLSQRDSNLLLAAERSMATLKPPRDPANIRMWRSETLKAFANVPELQEERKRFARDATTRIFSVIETFFPIIAGQPRSFEKLYEQIILPSVNLALDIQSSADQYFFSPQMDDPKQYRNLEKVGMNMIASIKAIDVSTRKTIKPNSPVVKDSRGFIGKPLLLVEPGLYRQSQSERRQKLLRQSTYLLELSHPLRKPGQE